MNFSKVKNVDDLIKISSNSVSPEKMLILLQQAFPKGKFMEGESWGGEQYKDRIIASAEEGEDSNGIPLFDYYADEERIYEMGINLNLLDFLRKNMWEAEFYDPGTAILYPEF